MKRLLSLFLALILLVASLPSCTSQADDDSDFNLFPSGLLAVSVNKKWGYVNEKGIFVIEPQFDYAEAFCEGLALVKTNDKYGFIDKKGNFVIEPIFDSALSFSDGLSCVIIDGVRSYINTEGECVLQVECEYARNFAEGFATIYTSDGYAVIDKTGNIVIKPQKYNYIGGFYNGYAIKRIMDEEYTNSYGIIDKNGNLVSKSYFKYIYYIGDGLFRFYLDGKFGFMNTDGEIVIEPKFEFAGNFSEGYASVSIEDNGEDYKETFIDKNGNVTDFGEFDYACDFKNGLAAVKIGEKYGFINTDGEFVIPAKFQVSTYGIVYKTRHFYDDGYALVLVDDKYGVINRRGDFVIEPSFEEVNPTESKQQIAHWSVYD